MDESKKQELNSVLTNLKQFWDTQGEQTVRRFINDISHWPAQLEDRKHTFSALEDELTDDPIVVLTANKVEANMMVRLLAKESSAPLPATVIDECWYRVGKINGINIVHIQPQDMSSFTPNGSCRALTAAFRRIHPKLVVSLGVAFGIDEQNQHLGDVIVSDKLCTYDSKNHRTKGKLQLHNEGIYQTDSSLMCAWKNPLSYKVFPESTSHPFEWHCGLVLSGGTVLSDGDEKKRLVEALKDRGHVDCVGGEMEGNGMYFSCSIENVPCVVIKGICDWGEEKNGWDDVIEAVNKERGKSLEWSNKTIKNCVQALAMANAFSAFKYLLHYFSAISNSDDRSHQTTRFIKWSDKYHFPSEKAKLILTVVASLFLLISTICLLRIIWQQHRDELLSPYFVSTSIILTLSLFYLGAVFSEYRSRPEKLIVEAASIHIRKLDFQNCICELKNINDYPLRNCNLAWISKRKRMVIRVHKVNKLEAHEKLKIGYQYIGNPHYWVENAYDIPCPIIPDALQIEYDLNGKRYCHVFRNPKQEKHKMLSYHEYIHRIGSKHFKNIISRRCSVPDFDVES